MEKFTNALKSLIQTWPTGLDRSNLKDSKMMLFVFFRKVQNQYQYKSAPNSLNLNWSDFATFHEHAFCPKEIDCLPSMYVRLSASSPK